MNSTWMIIGMMAITISIKALIFVLGNRIVLSKPLKEALSFVPVTVLTAIIVPMILAPHGGSIEFNWRNPQLIAAIAAIIICAVTRHQLVTIVLGLAVFFGWQYYWVLA